MTLFHLPTPCLLIVDAVGPTRQDIAEEYLFPAPLGVIGWRVYEIARLAMPEILLTVPQWVAATERAVLCNPDWDSIDAVGHAATVLNANRSNRPVLMLGNRVAVAMAKACASLAPVYHAIPPGAVLMPGELDGFYMIPHPARSNRFWNNTDAYNQAARTMRRFIDAGERWRSLHDGGRPADDGTAFRLFQSNHTETGN